MSRKDWTAAVEARASGKPNTAGMVRARLVNGRKRHDQLEVSVRKLALLYGITLHKADATAVRLASGTLVTRATGGIPDLFGVVPPTGRALFVEIKTGEGGLRKRQPERIAQLTADGAAVFVVHSMNEAETIFKQVAADERRKSKHLERVNHETQ